MYGVFAPLGVTLLYYFIMLQGAYTSEKRRREAWLQGNRNLLAQLALNAVTAATEAERGVVAAALRGGGGGGGGAGADGETRSAEEDAAVLATWKIPLADLVFVGVLGVGSSAEVWQATLKGAPCAAKQLHRAMLSNAEAMDRFRNEIIVMSRLRHPQLALFLGATWEPPRVCLVMELFPGGAVFDVLRAQDTPLSFSDPLLKWACEVASAMHYLHRKSVLHRDLQSQNVMVTAEYSVKVADLGEARGLAVDTTMTSVGTPHFAAPEVLRSERYTEKVDVYSFGIFLYELATRELPYKRENPALVLQGVVSGSLRPAMPASAPAAVAQLAVACWAPDAAARPSCADVVAALQGIDRTGADI